MSRRYGAPRGTGSRAASGRRRGPWLAAGAALLLAAGAGRADLLVTTDGARVTTRGAWTVEGTMVRFHDAAGTLCSLRLADVDLEEGSIRVVGKGDKERLVPLGRCARYAHRRATR